MGAPRRRRTAAAVALGAVLQLVGCAGLPIGGHTFVVVGVGLVRVDKADRAIGISSRSLGLTVGCRQITLGAQASYCARLPIEGDVAIIERGSGPDQHLSVTNLRKEKTP